MSTFNSEQPTPEAAFNFKNTLESSEISIDKKLNFNFPFGGSPETISAALKAKKEVCWAYNPNTTEIKVWILEQNITHENGQKDRAMQYPYMVEPEGFAVGSWGTLSDSGNTWEEAQKTLTYASLAQGTVENRNVEKDMEIIHTIEHNLQNFTASL